MRVIHLTLLIVLSVCTTAQAEWSTQSFDTDWRFIKGDVKDAQEVACDDSTWQRVSVPHDWSIEGPFDENAPARGSGAFLPAGVGWYRKQFSLPADAEKKRVFVDFDGVMANSDVWVNGKHVGGRPYGYSSFRCDLTGHLNFGEGNTNVLAVRADNSQQPASRWYAGAGIYRHVKLVVTGPIHFEHWSNFITTPKVSADEATVHVSGVFVNQSDRPHQLFIASKVFDPAAVDVSGGTSKKQTIEPGKQAAFELDMKVEHPKIWDIDSPQLYRAVVDVVEDRQVLQVQEISFGIRSYEFKPESGFWLNGKNFKLKGVAVHGDGGAFGAAVPNAVWERRLKALKELGVNAIRTAHNPPSPDFLDLCDRLGFVVMDEAFDCWTVGKNPYDYHLIFRDWFRTDARDMVLRDRNHPSIILYSAGNEIHDTPKPDIAKPILADIVKVMHEADPTRPVTQALFRPNVSHDYDNGLADMLDVVGQNYRENEILAAHAQKPTRKIVGTENGHDRKMWLPMRDNPEYSGQFLWTGIDYLGESRRWPVIGAGSGLLDRTGTPKSRAWERQSWWSDKPMVKIARRVQPTGRTPDDPGFEPLTRVQSQFCDWTPKSLEAHEESVEIYSNCETAELILNGQSLGTKDKPKDDSPRVWKVKFEPGTIKAIARNADKIVATDELQTAGKAAKIVLSVDRAKLTNSWDDVAFVQATVVDEKGVAVPNADDLVQFTVTGPAVIVRVDNGDNSSHESFQASERHVYQGVCFAMIKAAEESGKASIDASADGLAPASISIELAGSPSK